MAVQIAVSLKVLHGDGSVIATNDRSMSVMNPTPRDTLNDGDLAKKSLEQMMSEMQAEAEEQVDTWKHAMANLMGGGS